MLLTFKDKEVKDGVMYEVTTGVEEVESGIKEVGCDPVKYEASTGMEKIERGTGTGMEKTESGLKEKTGGSGASIEEAGSCTVEEAKGGAKTGGVTDVEKDQRGWRPRTLLCS